MTTTHPLGLRRGTVALVEWSPRWRLLFDELRAQLQAALGARASAVEHIGSTAIDGLPAKPIVDVAVRLAPAVSVADVAPALIETGLLERGAEGDHGGRLFVRAPAPEHRDAHVHIVTHDDPRWGVDLALRELLRTSAEARRRYAEVKRRLAREHPSDRSAYTAAKASVLAELLAAATAP